MNGLVAKEIRALLLPWLGCMAVVGAAALVNSEVAERYSIIVLVGGSCALGAFSLGHEYMAATLASMLAQPVSRVRVLAVKTAVLAAMLVALFTLFSAVRPFGGDPTTGVVAVATLSGLCLAPWFTLVTRSPVGGAVFGISILGVIFVLLNLLLPRESAALAFWRIAPVLGVAAVALTWRGFMRLEAIDGRGPHVHMAWDQASAAPRVRHATWAVTRKELGLQQIPFVLSAIYAISAVRVMGHAGEAARDVFGGLTILYSCVLALLIGSIASAEERQLGTLEWHQLLPMASWKQWLLKAGTAIALSLLLGVALPAVILLAATDGPIRFTGWYISGVVLFTALGLYVSSLSSSSLRALVVSSAIPLILLMAMGVTRFSVSLPWVLTPFKVALLAAFVVLLLRLGFKQHVMSR